MNTTQESASEYNNIARFILIGFLFLQPLIILPFGWNIYAPIRILLLYTVAILLFLIKINSFFEAKAVSFYKIRAFQWLVFFAGAIIVSSVFSMHLPSSFYGHYPRFEGLLTWLAYLVIFLSSVHLFAKKVHLTALFRALSLSSIIISVYGIAQYFGYDIISWGAQVMAIKRAFASLGNPISFGAYLTLILPINLYLATRKREAIYIIASFVNLLALIMTFSLGAWIGFLASLLCLAVFALKNKVFLNAKVLISFFVAILTISILVSVLATPGFINRVAQITKGQGSLEARMLLWKNALPMLTQRPLLGSGPDTFYLAFNQSLSPEYERKVTRNYPVDRAHNELLQIVLTMGLFALIPYIAFFYLLFSDSYQALSKSKDKFYNEIIIACLAGITGFFISAQTFFGSIDISPLFWAIVGVIFLSVQKIVNKKKTVIKLNPRLLKSYYKPILVIFSILVISFPVSHGIRVIAADYYYRQAKLAFAASYYNDSFYWYNKAIGMTSFNSFYHDEYGKALTQAGAKLKNEIYLERAVNKLEYLNRFNPNNSYYYMDAGRAYKELYKLNNQKHLLVKAKQKFSKGLQLDENFSSMRFELALVHYQLGNKQLAILNLEKSLETKATNILTYLKLAQYNKELGNLNRARYYLSLAKQRYPNNPKVISVTKLITDR